MSTHLKMENVDIVVPLLPTWPRCVGLGQHGQHETRCPELFVCCFYRFSPYLCLAATPVLRCGR